jgi:hypothetical protein
MGERLQERELNQSARLQEQQRKLRAAAEQPLVAVERIPEVAER